MPPRKFSQIEFDTAHDVRDAARAELFEVCPDLRPDAISITVVRGNNCLDVQAKVVGDTAPYEPEEVRFYLGELGLKLPQA